MKWIACKDRMPKSEKRQGFLPVLFVLKEPDFVGEDTRVCAGRYFPKTRQFVSLQGSHYSKGRVTHWAPVPKPPAQGKGDQR